MSDCEKEKKELNIKWKFSLYIKHSEPQTNTVERVHFNTAVYLNSTIRTLLQTQRTVLAAHEVMTRGEDDVFLLCQTHFTHPRLQHTSI